MKVIIPALSHDCPAAKALKCMGIDHTVHIMENDYSYAELISSLWGKEDFIIVEHDIIPYPEAFESLMNCNYSYCGCYYHIGGSLGGTLGFTKFEKIFTKNIPIDFTGVKWTHLDAKIAGELEKLDIWDFHRHYPSVTHLHDYGN